MPTALSLDDRPGGVIEDHDVRPLGIALVFGHAEGAAADLRNEDIPTPLKTAKVGVAQVRVDGEQRHARDVRKQSGEQAILLCPCVGSGERGHSGSIVISGGDASSHGRASVLTAE